MSQNSLKIEWWNVNFHEIDLDGNALNTGCILALPRLPNQPVIDLSEEKIRFYINSISYEQTFILFETYSTTGKAWCS